MYVCECVLVCTTSVTDQYSVREWWLQAKINGWVKNLNLFAQHIAVQWLHIHRHNYAKHKRAHTHKNSHIKTLTNTGKQTLTPT